MKRHGFLILLCAVLTGGLLFGCVDSILPLPEPSPNGTEPTDYSLYGTANYVPGQLEEDPYPLFVGARWLYRNAAKYWNPQISASGLLESEVVAVVQGDGVQCYVLRTHYSNGPDELLYLHRTQTNDIVVRDTRLAKAASGAQPSYSYDPGLAFLRLPFVEDAWWPLETSKGSGKAQVYHPEVVAIESGEVRTLLRSYSPVFLGSWRVHYDLPESSPRLYGGSMQFLWFAPGVGVVKHVLNSVNYELAEFRLPNEVVALDEQNDGQPVDVPSGGLVVVQIREGASGDGWEWAIEGNEDSVLEFLSDEFYPDTHTAFQEVEAGTHAFQFRALKSGEVTLRFERPGNPKRVVEYNIRVN